MDALVYVAKVEVTAPTMARTSFARDWEAREAVPGYVGLRKNLGRERRHRRTW